MSIEAGKPLEANPTNVLPTPEQNEVFAIALPVLAEMRNTRQVARAVMPEDQAVMPGQIVHVEPYYDAATDDHQRMGHWAVVAHKPGEKPSFRAMVSAQPDFAVKRLGAERTTAEDVEQVVSVLGLLAAGAATDTKAVVPPRKGLGRWLGRRAPHN
jgi:hypothetical protein